MSDSTPPYAASHTTSDIISDGDAMIQGHAPALLSLRVSLFPDAYTKPATELLPLAEVLIGIKEGRWRSSVEQVRYILAHGDADAYRQAKNLLDAFTPCCALTTRAQDVPMPEKLLSVTGLVYYHLDHLDDQAPVTHHLMQHPSVGFAFISPSGHGLKLGVAVDPVTGEDAYRHAWRVGRDNLAQSLTAGSFNEDLHVKFLHALCFVSDDPDLYMHLAAVPLSIPPPPPRKPRAQSTETEHSSMMQVAAALNCIPNHDADYDLWLALGMALHSTGESWARDLWDEWSQRSTKYEERKQARSWSSFQRDGKTTLGTLYHFAQQYGYRPADDPTRHTSAHTGDSHRTG